MIGTYFFFFDFGLQETRVVTSLTGLVGLDCYLTGHVGLRHYLEGNVGLVSYVDGLVGNRG